MLSRSRNGTLRQIGLSKYARASLTLNKTFFTNPEHSLANMSEYSQSVSNSHRDNISQTCSESDIISVKMITEVEHSDEALIANNQVNFNTRQTGFALNQSKQMKNLRKNAEAINYDTVINNFNENINLQCSSGFYLEVGSPALLSLAKQTCATSQLVVTGVRIHCSNTRISLDDHNLHVNSTYFFDLLDDSSGSALAKVTVHCHVTTRVIQLQGSKVVASSKAPVWFFENVLKNTFDREGSERRDSIIKTNEDIIQFTSTDLSCTHCDKKYKTAPGLLKHVQTKHETLAETSAQILPPDSRILRKRRGPDNSVTDCPPPKTMALESSTSSPDIAISSPVEALQISSTASLPEQPVVAKVHALATTSPSSGPSSISMNLNLNAEPFQPAPTLQTEFPHYNIQMPNTRDVSSTTSVPSSLASTATVSSSSIRPVSVPFVGMPLGSASTTAQTTNTSTVTVPTVAANATSASIPAAPKTKQTKKGKATLALTPEEFEKENIRVERDACRFEMNKLATEKKDLSETVEILTTRCRLFEEERNNAATKNAAPDAFPKGPTNQIPPVSVPPGNSSLETLDKS